MDRPCNEIFFLLIAGALIRSTFQNLHLPPKYIKVCEGDSVTINCTILPVDMKYKVTWHYYQTSNYDCDSNNKLKGQHRNTLYINDIRTNESGWYSCKVVIDIPYLKEQCSNGTQVIVDANITSTQENQNDTQNWNQNTTNVHNTCLFNATTSPIGSFHRGEWWIWLALAVGCVVLVVLIVVIRILTGRPKETIYENTKPQKEGCWTCSWNRTESFELPASKKNETIKPLRKYDCISTNKIRRP
ncbi:uncharacterized protein LOC127641411 [Xyrauchen texanus]|uniref:uncharacterized protein LOC127641411 n=1 Tax=Xyrauchen texanus TaxID=154827 RepID=UPI002242A13D|nr:uncharacterized protein LOC127641411 [Xyrauchen texanus]XP_051980374.1 uncharacterized protein LOC127641411 [Xyrauchen texanus]